MTEFVPPDYPKKIYKMSSLISRLPVFALLEEKGSSGAHRTIYAFSRPDTRLFALAHRYSSEALKLNSFRGGRNPYKFPTRFPWLPATKGSKFDMFVPQMTGTFG